MNAFIRATFASIGVAVAAAAMTSSLACNQVFGLKETVLAKTDYYSCTCNCGQHVGASGAPVFKDPGAGFLAFAPANAKGSVLDGPQSATFNNAPTLFWDIDFGSGLSGWVPQAFISLAGVQPLFAKDPDVCLPQQFNPYFANSTAPTVDDLQGLCAGDVTHEGTEVLEQKLSLALFCKCDAASVPLDQILYDGSCQVPCPGNAAVCLRAGSDPPNPTPEPMADALLQPVSTCVVTGEADIDADGHTPKTQPQVRGTLALDGVPCVGQGDCFVGASYALTADDIEFDSGTIFADDPKFVELGLTGATTPAAIHLGPFLGGDLGELPANSAFSSLHGRRSGSSDAVALNGENATGLALAVDWTGKTCRLAGELVGQAEGDGSEGTFDATIDVALDGVLVNQPPRANAGADQTVECTSTNGALVTLDGSATTDADGNVGLYEWRAGSASGPQVAAPSESATLQVQQALGSATYHLTAIDTFTAIGEDDVTVTVADTTAPTIACNAPESITPSAVRASDGGHGVSFTATAEDACTGVASVAVESVSCTRAQSCGVHVSADGATIVIDETGGVGNAIRWTVRATDGAGNTSEAHCGIIIVAKQ